MPTSSATTRYGKRVSHLTLPLFLYDLGAASQLLLSAAVLLEQFHSSSARINTAGGEVALMRAVLEDAITCFQRQFVTKGQRAQRLAREAEEWFFTNDLRWPFSFINICAVLGLDPDYVRLGIKRWRQEHSTEPLKQRRRAV